MVLARDRSGVKPLFYATTAAGDIVFGSEIKAILASGMIEPELDDTAVAEYFALGSVSGDRTLYRGIRKLEPGHTLTWTGGRTHIERYWELPAYSADVSPVRDLSHAASEFWTYITTAENWTGSCSCGPQPSQMGSAGRMVSKSR